MQTSLLCQPGLVTARKPAFQCKSGARVVRSRQIVAVRATAAVEVSKPAVDEATVERAINAIRFLSIDGVNAANSGHPGMLGLEQY